MTTFSYEQIIEEKSPRSLKKKELVAFCGSRKCAGNRSLVEKQNVVKHANFCPDCSYSLVWKHVNKNTLVK